MYFFFFFFFFFFFLLKFIFNQLKSYHDDIFLYLESLQDANIVKKKEKKKELKKMVGVLFNCSERIFFFFFFFFFEVFSAIKIKRKKKNKFKKFPYFLNDYKLVMNCSFPKKHTKNGCFIEKTELRTIHTSVYILFTYKKYGYKKKMCNFSFFFF